MESEEYTEELRGCPVKGNAYPVLVLGVGNPLMGDDGIGVELAHRLQERDYGPLVHVEEGGTLGMTLLPLLEEADRELEAARNWPTLPTGGWRGGKKSLSRPTSRPPILMRSCGRPICACGA